MTRGFAFIAGAVSHRLGYLARDAPRKIPAMLGGMPGRLERYFEDYTVGQKFGTGTVTVTAERIKAFGR